MYKPELNKKPDKIMPTAIKVLSAAIIFGIPLIPGTLVIAGYGAYRMYKKLKRQHQK